MNALFDVVALWLADFQLLTTVLLGVTLTLLVALRQPVHRMALSRSALIAVTTLAALCALPGWSAVHLQSKTPTVNAIPSGLAKRAPSSDASVAPMPSTESAAILVAPTATPLAATVLDATPMSWPRTLATTYAVGSAAVVLWLVAGSMSAGRLRRRAKPAPAAWREILRPIVGASRQPELLVSDAVSTPVALGLRRPAIILPTAFMQHQRGGGEASDEQSVAAEFAAILTHEWAHIDNGDLRTLALSRALGVLLWPQPLFWMLRRIIRLDQEKLADAAAAECAGRLGYAEQLVAWARTTALQAAGPRLAGAVGLWEGPSQLKRRVAALVDERFTMLRSCSKRWRLGCAMGIAAAAVGLSIVTLEPERLTAQEATDASAADGDEDSTTTHTVQTGGTFDTWAAVPGGTLPKPATAHVPNTLALRCVDEGGGGIADAEVLLYGIRTRDGVVEPLEQTRTGDAGDVEFRGLVPADRLAAYAEYAAKQQYPPSMDRTFLVAVRREGLATAVFGVSEFDLALFGYKKDVTLRPGQVLRGRVTDPAGEPVSDALVAAGAWASSFAIEGINAVRTDGSGRYEFRDRQAFDAARAHELSDLNRANLVAYEPTPDGEKLKKEREQFGDLVASNLVVKHSKFAVTLATGGNIPGEADIQMEPAATIVGRVVWTTTGAPASNVLVRAAGLRKRKPTDADGDGPASAISQYVSFSASTRTDGEGRYRLANLAAANYDVWATSAAEWKDAEWVCRGIGGIDAAGGEATAAPELSIGAGGVVRGQLVDATTGKSLAAGEGASVLASPILVGGPQQQDVLPQRVPCAADGTFEIRALPGKMRMLIVVFTGDGEGSRSVAYRSEDDVHASGAVLEIADGATIEAEFPVRSQAELEALRKLSSDAYALVAANKSREAIAAYTAILDKYPTMTNALVGRYQCNLKFNAHQAALADLERLIALAPDQPYWKMQLVRLLASSPDAAVRDGARAVELGTEIVEALRSAGDQENYAWALSLLAGAYAEAGDFDKAIATQREAIEAAPDERKAELRERMKMYESGKPYRLDAAADGNAADR